MTRLPFMNDDGGRSAAGYRGERAGDCVCRAIAIASGLPYRTVYQALAQGTGTQRASSRTRKRAASAREGINTRRKWFREYMASIGFTWVPLMKIGAGCTVHLIADELPAKGRYVLCLSRHYTALVDGVIHDTYDPQRESMWIDAHGTRTVHRCVYGYWRLNA